MAKDAATHVVLVGDSVFDNTAHVGRGPDVSAHLRRLLPSTERVSCCAVDGATTADMGGQLEAMPDDGTHLVLSLGGNDALLNADLLDLPVRSTGVALDLFRDRVAGFAESYGWDVEALAERRKALTVCTIYHADLNPAEAARAPTALALFNDAILRAALRLGANVIDLRAVCADPLDFTRAIEPSVTGGLKIAEAIVRALSLPPGCPARSVLLGAPG
ncbi:MAG: GDSL-type esterase/lipase family protein [Polyangiaceae bacterium]